MWILCIKLNSIYAKTFLDVTELWTCGHCFFDYCIPPGPPRRQSGCAVQGDTCDTSTDSPAWPDHLQRATISLVCWVIIKTCTHTPQIHLDHPYPLPLSSRIVNHLKASLSTSFEKPIKRPLARSSAPQQRPPLAPQSRNHYLDHLDLDDSFHRL